MSSFTEPSSIVLIVGAVCIFIFIIHGLWFSGKPQNRKLKKDNQRDQELSKSSNVGKVRIVSTTVEDSAGDSEVDLNIGKINKSSAAPAQSSNVRHMSLPEGFDDGYRTLENAASISVNQKSRAPASADELAFNQMNRNQLPQGGNSSNWSMQAQGQAQSSYGAQGHNAFGQQNQQQASRAPLSVYELIVSAGPDRVFSGNDIEAICNQYGFIQGFIKDNLKIYFVYENAATKENEVFRICSMEAPYYFPENMQDYKTSAIALYMSLPERGKAFAYFKALRMATEIFISQLGGQIQDQHRNPLNAEQLDAIAAELQSYDSGIHNN